MATVLVIDDELALQQVLAQLLELEGYTVATADDGPHALAVLAAVNPDVVLCDVMMPGSDGFVVKAALQEQRPTLPVILMSGSLDRLQSARDAGWPVLDKPFVIDELFEIVQRVLQPLSAVS